MPSQRWKINSIFEAKTSQKCPFFFYFTEKRRRKTSSKVLSDLLPVKQSVIWLVDYWLLIDDCWLLIIDDWFSGQWPVTCPARLNSECPIVFWFHRTSTLIYDTMRGNNSSQCVSTPPMTFGMPRVPVTTIFISIVLTIYNQQNTFHQFYSFLHQNAISLQPKT